MMKIEYLNNTNPDDPKESILRIFDFDSSEARQFKDVLSQLANDSVFEVDMNSLPFVESVGGCRLTLKAGSRDKGVQMSSRNTFECILTRTTWSNVKYLVEPFCEGDIRGYFQWLYDLSGDIELLLSPDGGW